MMYRNKLWTLVFSLFCFILNAQNDSVQSEDFKVGLVLSGGGAKGYAHIGALKVLEDAGVKIDYIGGTSIGAIIGGLYASGYSAEELEETMYSLDLTGLLMNEKSREELPFFDKSYREKYILELPFDNFKLRFPNALSSGQGTADELTYLFRHKHNINDFDDLPIPFLSTATKLETGESVVFREGYLPQVVLASGAYPTLLEPVRINGELYVDGGIRNNYPVQEVIDMGANFIIGIDLQEGLMPQKDLNSAAKIIEQIITYGIVDKSIEQSKLVDLVIKPDITGYTVTSFDKKEELITVGREAALKVLPELRELASKQGNPEKRKDQVKDLNDYILITDLRINGLESYNQSYIKGKLAITTPMLLSYENLREGVKRLYSSGNFQKVYYRILDNEQGHKTLAISLVENPTRQSLKLGLHYDDVFKTGLLLNFTAKSILFKNSTLSADLILGDFARYTANYYVDNGIYPSFAFHSDYKQFRYRIRTGNFFPDMDDVDLDYKFNTFLNQAFLQSTLSERYAIGGGIEHLYNKIYTAGLTSANPYKEIDNNSYVNIYGFVKADNLDNPNFPMKGIKLDGVFKVAITNSLPEENKFVNLTTKFQINKPLNSWLTLNGFGKFGTFFSNDAPMSLRYVLGGYVEQDFINYTRLYGFKFSTDAADNLLLVGARLRSRFLKNHYASAVANFASIADDDLSNLKLTQYKYSGYGIEYGYDSPLGPIIGIWHYSPNTKSGLFNVSLGFWF